MWNILSQNRAIIISANLIKADLYDDGKYRIKAYRENETCNDGGWEIGCYSRPSVIQEIIKQISENGSKLYVMPQEDLRIGLHS